MNARRGISIMERLENVRNAISFRGIVYFYVQKIPFRMKMNRFVSKEYFLLMV